LELIPSGYLYSARDYHALICLRLMSRFILISRCVFIFLPARASILSRPQLSCVFSVGKLGARWITGVRWTPSI